MTTEKDYISSIHVAYTIGVKDELWYAMLRLAEIHIHHGDTQKASDILAFILLQEHNISSDIYEEAFELFDDLERRICPRVIWDARAFANDMDIQGMVEYILERDLD